jgi:hypothetical protein
MVSLETLSNPRSWRWARYLRQGKIIASQVTVSYATIAGMNLGMFSDLRADHCVLLYDVIVSKTPL